MPYPAYQGALFYFSIVIGSGWVHEFKVLSRTTGEPTVWEPDWQALCVIRDSTRRQVATLTHLGPAGGADGLITLSEGLISLSLGSDFTAGMAPTTTYGKARNKPFLFADLTLTDPLDGESYLAASGQGVAYKPTTIGA